MLTTGSTVSNDQKQESQQQNMQFGEKVAWMVLKDNNLWKKLEPRIRRLDAGGSRNQCGRCTEFLEARDATRIL